ncbi:MarR family winged helix-turn-helix transcriptional regulator [Quadrisphaera sp. DSM 44207]|uniref:MarR family winged helix-turn-helix transcriptional regulator n=1 Tax=Quadrisphaera sp. DSM 44207 TaxID=1881057 RepID=UPI000890A73C|nr:MarR family transcriptional regulator [Quadrisphaera sp. DSM 44207]SDQ07611.1 DNA-binding transcriptional regulator, MarR family [Quadrisphaera sp. DSM 44207]
MAVQGEQDEQIDEGDSLFRPGQRARVLQLLRSYTDTHVELTRHLARTLGVHVSDAVAVAEVLWAESTAEPLTPARLSERTGLTSGATATLLNRLETSGLVVRSREDADRRVVRVRLTPRARARTEEFFTPTGEQLDRVLDGYGDAVLEQVEHLLTNVVAAMTAHNAHLRTTSPANAVPPEDRSVASGPGAGRGPGTGALGHLARRSTQTGARASPSTASPTCG